MGLDGIATISHERIYKFIYEEQAAGGSLYKHLRIRGVRKYKNAMERAIIEARYQIG